MKIAINFIPRPGKFAVHIAIGLWVLSAILVMTSVFLLFRIGNMYREVPALKARLEQFNSRLKGVDAVALPPRDEMIAVKESIASINKLSGSHNGSLLSALVKLEAQLPNDVGLVELSYRRRAGEIQMAAEAASNDVVGKLLQELEHSGQYSEVLLARQSSGSDQNSGRVLFEISLKERP
jgi:Fimbrial assembly protein (PilN)